MTITAIHSKNTGSTRGIATMLLDEIRRIQPDAVIHQYVVADFPSCVGCFTCFAKGEQFCPHYESVHPIITAIEGADVVILDSPTYCMGIAGALKNFLDHLGYRWFAHRPHPAMAHKIGVAISTTGSMGARTVTKALKTHFFGWGAAKYYRLSFAVMATKWDDVAEKKKRKIERTVKSTAQKVVQQSGRASRSLYLRLILSVMKIVQKKNNWFPLDKAWWQEQGWIR